MKMAEAAKIALLLPLVKEGAGGRIITYGKMQHPSLPVGA
jgi:hypothetical protein